MIKAILFDLWNTLVYDSSKLKSFEKLLEFLKSFGVKNPHEFIDRFLCIRKFDSIMQASEHISRELGCRPEEAEPFVRGFALQEPKAFPDVASALGRLRKDYKLAIISNFIDFTANAVEKSGIEKFFDYRFYSCNLGMIKQNPEFFRHALREMGVKPQEAVMVGDRKFADIEPAERAGIRAVLIKREGFPIGYVEREKFKRTIKTLDELDKYLRP